MKIYLERSAKVAAQIQKKSNSNKLNFSESQKIKSQARSYESLHIFKIYFQNESISKLIWRIRDSYSTVAKGTVSSSSSPSVNNYSIPMWVRFFF